MDLKERLKLGRGKEEGEEEEEERKKRMRKEKMKGRNTVKEKSHYLPSTKKKTMKKKRMITIAITKEMSTVRKDIDLSWTRATPMTSTKNLSQKTSVQRTMKMKRK